jgi:Domain of unknown function (DUF5063)
MEKISLQCGRMASVACEYCALIDGTRGRGWVQQLIRLFPRLHVAVTALTTPSGTARAYGTYDDEKRCDLFLSLNDDLQADRDLSRAYGAMCVGPYRQQQLSERMADNLADIYFDLQHGLKVFEDDSQHASEIWQYSFYMHWGKHLLDAECWLHAVECGCEPVLLPEWQWPDAGGTVLSPA